MNRNQTSLLIFLIFVIVASSHGCAAPGVVQQQPLIMHLTDLCSLAKKQDRTMYHQTIQFQLSIPSSPGRISHRGLFDAISLSEVFQYKPPGLQSDMAELQIELDCMTVSLLFFSKEVIHQFNSFPVGSRVTLQAKFGSLERLNERTYAAMLVTAVEE